MVDYARTHRWLAAAAGVLGALALVAGDPYSARGSGPAARDVQFVTAVDLARMIRDGRLGVHVIDLRADSLFEAYHVPGAERVGRAELTRDAPAAADTIILYAEDDATAIEAARALERRGTKEIRILRGGLLSWVDQIVQPRLATLPPTATPDEQSARREQLELSRYFGGTPYVSPEVSQPSRASEAAAVARILRRGC